MRKTGTFAAVLILCGWTEIVYAQVDQKPTNLLPDPYETVNLVGSPAHQAILATFRNVLDRWLDESNDQGKQLEPPELAAAKGATKPTSDPNAPAGGKAAKQKAKKQKAATEAR